MSNIRSVVDWLTDGARSGIRSEDVLEQLCERMLATGIPLWRVAVFVNTLHPDVFGRRFVWQAGEAVAVAEGSYDLLDTEMFRNSPIRAVRDNGLIIRRRLADADCPMDYPVLLDYRAEGATDYVAFPLVFTDGVVHVASWTTRQPGGFTAEQFADLEAIVAPLARVAEIRALRRTAVNLLSTYVGHQAGDRILAGRIRRGFVETIRAAIWLSDMRGFTALSERLPPQDLVDLLNRYFDCQVPTILDRGGEVLKFIGDGLLAIFPLSAGGDDATEVCRRALACARETKARIDALDREGGPADQSVVRFGLALHLGPVMYGNIGGGNRLDFTCIGPAVNLAARLESIAGQLGHTIVASEEFAAHVPDELKPLGAFPVAGFAVPQEVFSLG
jgi:adenylate cyclase